LRLSRRRTRRFLFTFSSALLAQLAGARVHVSSILGVNFRAVSRRDSLPRFYHRSIRIPDDRDSVMIAGLVSINIEWHTKIGCFDSYRCCCVHLASTLDMRGSSRDEIMELECRESKFRREILFGDANSGCPADFNYL